MPSPRPKKKRKAEKKSVAMPSPRKQPDVAPIILGSDVKLVDLFASDALTGICGALDWSDLNRSGPAIAAVAYGLADAMVAQRAARRVSKSKPRPRKKG